MAAWTTMTAASRLSFCCSANHLRKLSSTRKVSCPTKFTFSHSCKYSDTARAQKSSSFIRASNSPEGRQDTDKTGSAGNTDGAFISKDDREYLSKLLVGSVAGAALIKYGSILFPQITRPNITQAMIMIFTPVILAVLLLVRESLAEKQD